MLFNHCVELSCVSRSSNPIVDYVLVINILFAFFFMQSFNIGDTVLARWSDTRYYQGKIRGINPNGSYRVKFYDGLEKSVQAGNIREMPEELRPIVSPQVSDLFAFLCIGVQSTFKVIKLNHPLCGRTRSGIFFIFFFFFETNSNFPPWLQNFSIFLTFYWLKVKILLFYNWVHHERLTQEKPKVALHHRKMQGAHFVKQENLTLP